MINDGDVIDIFQNMNIPISVEGVCPALLVKILDEELWYKKVQLYIRKELLLEYKEQIKLTTLTTDST